jgi:hypothetical protein
MRAIGITGLFGFVSLILSYGLFLPADLKSFSLIAAVASMAGYFLGNQIRVRWAKILLVVVMAALCVACILSYVLLVERGSGDTIEVVRLALLLFGIFFSFSFLMPLVGFSIQQNAK